MAQIFENVPNLVDITTWATQEEINLAATLIEAGQSHLFQGWTVGADIEEKHSFFQQVANLQRSYPGGLGAYCSNARNLLKSSSASENPFEGMKPEVPVGKKLEYGTPDFSKYELLGLQHITECAFVLVAGGLGERLGYSDIKLSLPVESTTGMCYLQLYVAQLLAMQERANKMHGTNKVIPLAIMTSDDTHDRTIELLRSHNNFGASPGQIIIMKQEKVASLLDINARIAISSSNPYEIDTKPHGHGDIHVVLAKSGVAERWLNEGFRYIVFFQDTNSLCFTVTTAAVGVSVETKYEVNSIAVPRKAKDAVGAITKLNLPSGGSLTINVEYNQLEPMLKTSGFPEGDVNGPDGFSPFPGNINQLVFSLPMYVTVLKTSGGLVPEFVNPKYADAERKTFKKPTRLECMMQDLPKLYPESSLIGFTEFPDWTYSPVKNDAVDALAKVRAGVPGRCAAEGELEFYASYVRLLREAGVTGITVDETKVSFPPGFDLTVPPRILIHPSTACSADEYKSRFPTPSKISISSKSSLVVKGGVTIESLNLDGSLRISAVPGANVTVKNLVVHNKGGKIIPLDVNNGAVNSVPDWIRIRGFTVQEEEVKEYNFSEPGDYIIDEQ